MHDLASTLRQLVQASGKSEYRIARDAGMDVAYVRWLISGEMRNPWVVQLARLACGIVACSERIEARPEL